MQNKLKLQRQELELNQSKQSKINLEQELLQKLTQAKEQLEQPKQSKIDSEQELLQKLTQAEEQIKQLKHNAEVTTKSTTANTLAQDVNEEHNSANE